MWFLAILAYIQLLIQLNLAGATDATGAAQCAIYGNCGKKSFLGSELPCPVQKDFEPEPASDELKELVVSVCGEE